MARVRPELRLYLPAMLTLTALRADTTLPSDSIKLWPESAGPAAASGGSFMLKVAKYQGEVPTKSMLFALLVSTQLETVVEDVISGHKEAEIPFAGGFGGIFGERWRGEEDDESEATLVKVLSAVPPPDRIGCAREKRTGPQRSGEDSTTLWLPRS